MQKVGTSIDRPVLFARVPQYVDSRPPYDVT
jgi:hypothetical protein